MAIWLVVLAAMAFMLGCMLLYGLVRMKNKSKYLLNTTSHPFVAREFKHAVYMKQQPLLIMSILYGAYGVICLKTAFTSSSSMSFATLYDLTPAVAGLVVLGAILAVVMSFYEGTFEVVTQKLYDKAVSHYPPPRDDIT